MRITVCAAMALFVVSGFTVLQAAGSGSGDEAALKAIEEKWDAASLKGDAAALSSIFADGFISTSPEGKVRTKAEVLAQIKAGEIKYNVAKVEDMKVYLHGDSAVVSGKWKGNFVEKGKTTDSTERFTDMFVRQNGQWRCVASHASPLK